MANSGEFEIQIGEHTFTRSYLENNPVEATRIYKKAKKNGDVPICRCIAQGVKMQITHIEKYDTYVLKRRANSGKLHHVDCWSHGEPQTSKGITNYIAALTTKESGAQDIKINVPISFSFNSSTPKPSTPTPRSSQNQRASVGLTGLFEYIWSKAGFMVWEPDTARPKYVSIRDKIQSTFREDDSCNSHSINDLLYMPYYEKWPIFCNLIKHKTGFSNKQKADRRIIILGLVNALDTNAYGKVMKLYTIQDNVSFYINKRDTINHLTNSLPCIDDSYQHDKAHDGYYWFIGTAFPQERKNSEYITPIIDEGTIIQVSREHIPLNTIST